eukprot:gnl/MRDRNA2_/MRDRNA2_95833_c0_seq1.p1 gnl/MRDRNA2_/MRDRNA2_95833_c0~~gnl/MRDRNA2_/MRDRNA2_95833_c0_seq1.p1  ORF type:complete len:650 (-),score=127.55 gnl/MRDRNA2_/MRDRNA2_95833_c0_seq1:96-1814(-)
MPSVWDHFADPKLRGKEQVRMNHNGDPANRDYLHYESKTVPLLKDLGVKYYRMSISWTRVLHNQTKENPAGVVNQAGIDHYKQVFAALRKGGIEPFVTMWHWDTPQHLEEQYGGFLNRELMPKFFGEYAKVLIKNFGSDCKYWITLNEPLTVVQNGYSNPGSHAPGRCSNRTYCFEGDDQTEPYLAGHTMILAHAHAFKAFKDLGAEGTIGITLNADWCEPLNPDDKEDQKAAQRCLEGQNAWFFDPIYFGKYPDSMIKGVGDRLPEFTADELKLVHGSHMNVYFQNQYTAVYAQKRRVQNARKRRVQNETCGHDCDLDLFTSKWREDVPIGQGTPANQWLYKYPSGFRSYQKWISDRYSTGDQKMNIIVTENGWGDPDTDKEENLYDLDRCNYYREYIGNMSLAVNQDDVHVLGYFAWSLMDNFEWAEGYTTRFGLTYMDYETQVRTPKLSFRWMAKHVMPLKKLPKDGILPPCSRQEFDDIRQEISLEEHKAHTARVKREKEGHKEWEKKATYQELWDYYNEKAKKDPEKAKETWKEFNKKAKTAKKHHLKKMAPEAPEATPELIHHNEY